MAIVGDAYIVVRALTDKVEGDIRRGFSGVEGAGRQAGEKMGDAFTRGFNRNTDTANVFSRFSQGLKTMVPEAERARQAWAKLTRVSFVLGPAISLLVGGIGALIGGLGALVGSAGGAAASLVIIGNGFVALRLGALAAKLALGGVGRALNQLNNSAGGGSALADNTRQIAEAERALALVIENNRERLVDANNDVRQAQLDLNEAFKEGREEIQQLGFEAEDAALAEQQAAIDLTKAREVLARVQDLPPNSRVRKEAELAYQEAELNLRKAKDRSADLNKEQDRLARTGVSGTAAVVNATQRLAQAEANKAKVVRDSIRDQISAEESLANAKDNSASAGGGADPFAGLNEYQVRFVQFLQGLKPLYEELELVASKAFLVPLQQAIQLMADKAFPTIRDGIEQVAGAMGNAAISIAEAVTETENLSDLKRIFESSATVIEGLGRTLGNVWDAATSVLTAAIPLTERFVGFLESKSESLANFLDTKQATGELRLFFDRAGDIMADFGEIFGNIFQGFGQLIKANFGPGSGGDYLVQWLKTSTDKFANLDKLAGGSTNLSKYFEGASVNAQKILSSIGALLTEFIKLGDDPNIGIAFDKLAEGAPIIGEIARKFLEAAPAAAGLLVNIIGIVDKFTDTASVQIYFGILTGAVSALNSLLENELVANLVATIGILASVGLAFGTIFKVGKLAFEGIIGAITLASGNLGAFTKAIGVSEAALGATAATGMRGAMGSIATFMTGPWGVAIAAAVLGLTLLGQYLDSISASSEDIKNSLVETGATAETIFEVVGQGSEIKWFADVTGQLDNLNDVLAHNADFWGHYNTSYFGAYNALKDIGTQLQSLAKTDLVSAQDGFRLLADKTDGSRQKIWDLLNSMPAFKTELENQAKARGILTDSMSEEEKQQILVNAAMADGSYAADYHKTKLQELSDQIVSYTNTAVAAANSEIAFERAIDDNTTAIQAARDEFVKAGGNIDEFKMSLDDGDEAGRRNLGMLTNLASSTSRLYEQTLAQTGSQEQANAKLEEGRKALYDQAIQMGATEAQAQALTDQYLAVPKTVDTKANLEDKDAKAKKDELASDKTSTITSRINATKGTGWLGNLWAAITGQPNAVGGMYNYGGAGGNVVKAFANGGMAPGIFSGSAGPLYKFAEPETRWEAFISGKRGQEKRNIEIWKEAGKRLGVLGTENANGNIYGTGQAGTMGGSANYNNISITVNPAPGMNETELAAAVSREITFQMRRGAVA